MFVSLGLLRTRTTTPLSLLPKSRTVILLA